VSQSEWYIFCDVDLPAAQYKLYKISHSFLSRAKINKTTTLVDQWEINKVLLANKQRAPRPRFSMRKFVKENDLRAEHEGLLIDHKTLREIKRKHDDFLDEVESMI